MKYKIAVVEDEKIIRDDIKSIFSRYQKEHGIEFNITFYPHAYALFDDKHMDFDAIFMDIQMPGMNGMEAAHKIREHNQYVLLVFVTNLTFYAVEGYEVHAYDYIVKPLQYAGFSMKLDRICNELAHRLDDTYITLSTRAVKKRVRVADISYVEVKNHNLIYYLNDTSFSVRGIMQQAEEELAPYHFARCNSSYLINLKHVKQITGKSVIVGDHELSISQTKRHNFLCEYAKYAGGSV